MLILCTTADGVSSGIWFIVFNVKCRYVDNVWFFYRTRKVLFIPAFCKRINRTSTVVGSWLTAFEERRRTTFSATKFIYNNNNNNNKQGFIPNGTNSKYLRVRKRVQGSDRW